MYLYLQEIVAAVGELCWSCMSEQHIKLCTLVYLEEVVQMSWLGETKKEERRIGAHGI